MAAARSLPLYPAISAPSGSLAGKREREQTDVFLPRPEGWWLFPWEGVLAGWSGEMRVVVGPRVISFFDNGRDVVRGIGPDA